MSTFGTVLYFYCNDVGLIRISQFKHLIFPDADESRARCFSASVRQLRSSIIFYHFDDVTNVVKSSRHAQSHVEEEAESGAPGAEGRGNYR